MNEAPRTSGFDLEHASPFEKRAAAGGRGMEKKRVAMAPITPEMMQLSIAETKLEKDIEDLQTQIEGRSDDTTTRELQKKLVKVKENRRAILDRLVELAPTEFTSKKQWEEMQDQASGKRGAERAKKALIEVAVAEKDDLETTRHDLKGKLLLAKGEHKEVLGKNVARSGELETQIRELENELEETEKQRLEAWKTLSELDPAEFKKDADEEIAFAAITSRGMEKTNESEIDDLLANLHEGIEKTD